MWQFSIAARLVWTTTQMIDEVSRRRPDVVFFGAMIAAAGGAAQLNRFHAAMQKIKESRPKR